MVVQRTATKRKADEPLQPTIQDLESLETRMMTMVTNKIEQMSHSIMEVVHTLQLEVAAVTPTHQRMLLQLQQLNHRVSIVELITQNRPLPTPLPQSPRSASPSRTSRSTSRDSIPNLTPSPLAPPKLQVPSSRSTSLPPPQPNHG
ncbi:hypothetical protein HPB47_020635 [Ixodes persulcatus]|uniref:Uncharacterized protein n=1 Tax=Ixodes persulcatus TaxID=34615 RepID=A0AC60QF63_IXOPE|nr:hypothetical protein HPB47_020635 [Ixodes persulcatus]